MQPGATEPVDPETPLGSGHTAGGVGSGAGDLIGHVDEGGPEPILSAVMLPKEMAAFFSASQIRSPIASAVGSAVSPAVRRRA